MKLVIGDISLRPDQPESRIGTILHDEFGLEKNPDYKILKKSLDARKKERIRYRYRILVEVSDEKGRELLAGETVSEYRELAFPAVKKTAARITPLIVGSGPAGLFCALRLIESGITVTILERGRPVHERMKDIALLENKGELNPETNVLFGEGGAGAYSDGKLTTRTNRPESAWFYEKLVEHGAPGSVFYEARPHLGTDGVRSLVRNIRKTIIDSGSEILFGKKATSLLVRDGAVHGVTVSGGEEIPGSPVVLGTGHSARDVYRFLSEQNIRLEKKDFAVGVRVEHPAELVRDIQYGNSEFIEKLPPAEYFLARTSRKTGRGVYSFCMCPGGRVINSSSESGRLCTNGMSNSLRDGGFSNAAIVVSVRGDDIDGDVLSGIEFQRDIESRAFETGGNDFTAPAQRITSFLDKKTDYALPGTSYLPGIVPAMVDNYLPSWVTEEIRNALGEFDRKMRGFVTGEGLLIGAETRTSSPVRVARGENMESLSVRGLYPVGEGAGYAGGIVSSAVDGIRAAEAIINSNST